MSDPSSTPRPADAPSPSGDEPESAVVCDAVNREYRRGGDQATRVVTLDGVSVSIAPGTFLGITDGTPSSPTVGCALCHDQQICATLWPFAADWRSDSSPIGLFGPA
jgi:hypothetical protein